MKHAETKHRPSSHDHLVMNSTARANAKAHVTGNDQFSRDARSRLSAEWRAFGQLHGSRLAAFQISTVVNYFSRHGITPANVTENSLAEFDRDFATSGRTYGAGLTNSFRRAIAAVADGQNPEGLPSVDPPIRRAPRQIQWETLPAILREDVETYLANPEQPRSMAAQTTQRNFLLRIIATLNAAGVQPLSLIEVFADNALDILFQDEAYGCLGEADSNRAYILEFGRRYLAWKCPDMVRSDILAEMLTASGGRPDSGLSAARLRLLDQFDTRGVFARLANYCHDEIVAWTLQAGDYGAWAMAQACLIALLMLETGMPRRDALRLEFSGPAGGTLKRPTLVLPVQGQAKSQSSLEDHLSQDTVRDISLYFATCSAARPQAVSLLWANAKGQVKSAATLSVAVQRIGAALGLVLPVNLLRDLTVLYLCDHGASKKEVMDVLGISQTVNFDSRYGQAWADRLARQKQEKRDGN